MKNSGYTSLQWTLDDIDTFKPAKDIIERAMASLRIGIPNLETGYAQVIARPKGWEFYFTQDISDCFVAIERAYPGYFERYGWLKFSATVTFAELEKVRRAFLTYGEVPQLQLGYKRLNKACINSREDDTIIDIMIALESLLTSDSKSEITYRLATRAVLLNKLMPFGRSTDKEVFDFCKKIYDFRSSVVHGSPQKQQNKKRLIKVNQDREIQAIEGGLEFLKHVLWVLINHPMKPEEIDNIIYN